MKIPFYKFYFITLIFCLIASNLLAQEAGKTTVSGIITSASSGEMLIGAIVREKGTNNGVTTDLNGEFIISVPYGATLVISYVGFTSQEEKYTGQKKLQIQLKEDVKTLDEVVVTALGIKKQTKALGYAVAEVKGDEITAGRETNAIAALSGKLAGVDISTTSAGPSGSIRVIIRGNSQLTGSNMPLYVIDGLPMDNTQLGSAGQWGGYDMGDGLSGINPDDIESVTVLKGPSASALYGSRASNGVVLLTTKSGKGRKGFGVEFSTNVNAVSLLSYFDDYQRVYGQGNHGQPPLVQDNAQSNTQSAWGAKLDPNMNIVIYNGEEKPYGNINNNIMSFFRTGWTYTNTLAISNSNEDSNFRLSFSDMRNTDIVPLSDMYRTTVMFKGGATLAKKLHAESRINYTTEGVNNRPALSDNPNNIGNSLIGLAPNFDQKWLSQNYKDEYGRYNDWNGGNIYRLNPYWVLNEMDNYSKKNRFMGQANMSYDILPSLSASVKASTDYYNFHFNEYAPPSTPGMLTGRMQDLTTTVFENNYEAMLQFNKHFFDDVLDVSAFAGGNIMQYQSETYTLTGQNEVIPGIKDITNYNPVETGIQHSIYRKQINSLFGAVNLGYKNFLYLDMTFRNDVSSTLAKGNRSYFYPSVSGSFILSEIINLKPARISFAKLRASWAKVGGDTDPYRLDLTYNIAPYAINGKPLGMISSDVLPNRNLKPTSTYSYEGGMDIRFFDNRLNFDLGYYHQSTIDQIMQLPLTSASLYSSAIINAGEIVNQGFELATSVIPVKTKNFEWTANINLSKNRNKIVSLHPEVKNYVLAEARWAGALICATEGAAYGSIMGYKFARNENGDIIYENGLPTFENQISILGNGNNNFLLGFGNNFRYKNVTLGLLLDSKFGADIYSMSAMSAHVNGTSKETLAGRAEWYDSEEARQAAGSPANWVPTGGFVGNGVVNTGTKENPVWEKNTTPVDPQVYWNTIYNNTPEPFIYDASYIKLRELTLSYSLPKRILVKTFLQEVAFTAYGRNLWIFYTKLNNIDPESNYNNGNGQGFEYGSLPSRRTYGFGINVKF